MSRRSEKKKESLTDIIKVGTGGRRVLTVFLLFLSLVLVVSVLFVEINAYNNAGEQIVEYRLKTQELKDNLENNMDDINDRFATQEIMNLFTANDIRRLSPGFWEYALFVNDKKWAGTDTITIRPNDMISLKVTQKESSLPKAILAKGSLTEGDPGDNIANHLIPYFIDKRIAIKLIEKTEGLVTTYIVDNADFKSNDEVTLSLSGPLQERLAYGRNTIVVKVR